jgi:hypothetical protein
MFCNPMVFDFTRTALAIRKVLACVCSRGRLVVTTAKAISLWISPDRNRRRRRDRRGQIR